MHVSGSHVSGRAHAKAGRSGRARHRTWWRSGVGAAAAAAVVLFGTAAGAQVGARPATAAADLSMFQHGTVPVDGGTLHYVKGGTGPVLVLLHGWPETWWEWRDVMPELAKSHTVVAFDLPGLGSSSVPSGGFDMAHAAARIHQAVTTLGLGKVGLLTHDLGALVGYDYARDYPSDVTRLAALETMLNGFGLENAYSLSWHFLFNQSPKPVPENIINDYAHVKTYLGWLFSSARHPDAIDQARFFAAYSDPTHRSAGFEYYRAFPANAADNKANADRKLTMPVLAMGAQYVFGPGVAQSFQAVATDVRQAVAPDSGHWIPEENSSYLKACADLFFGPPPATPPTGDLAPCAP
ncbi:alpha/beta fold hydrolase [Actinomadura rupiterrae]|uniref:alpha/beta fold hydrolase n=1 Tax=Actinomadura rupiterrae TaxID=559627 RepID=UPI0020A39B75|nr:alpha/beta hydrolase [Actinomadura rupiterrae]MCP2336098.1 pimeloyl-ACP methyl ester carboxylesterase [Actinomadura rupiterrae]